MPFKFKQLKIPGLTIINCHRFKDERGFLVKTYLESEFKKAKINYNFKEYFYSFSIKNAIHGLHYQKYPSEQGKLIHVTKGKIFDVAVDIRKNSKFYGKWESVILSEKDPKALWIPPGFAHGYQSLEDSCVNYLMTSEYSKLHESGIIWNDKKLNINWPIKKPLVSKRDSNFEGFNY
ncbi:MAG: dTDP-4-dehydrorhamnose 3,5-epimerase [Candidatus Micrarchaeaceae archaeon]